MTTIGDEVCSNSSGTVPLRCQSALPHESRGQFQEAVRASGPQLRLVSSEIGTCRTMQSQSNSRSISEGLTRDCCPGGTDRRLVGVPSSRHRLCLVAVTGCSANDGFLFGNKDIRIGGFDARFSFNKGYVVGILTLDTVADFLPRKGPLRRRRTGIAYVSNVAVRECFRRKGIAKRLMAKAEAQARIWGCRAIALHCDTNNPGATKLYKGQGFKCIKVPEGANWPQPKTSPDIRFNFMMKLL
ncbi:hypothetical protein MLD38_038088 [Melastoma candidum]|uniref:Uncharacterized protein n=1 Tax=Melastoma candidum TaxID=119954 RepID=A0ACB9KYN9_9MYRT|nr:hypothetical protein MLD38_038088 [Melastoma candidum]